MKPSLGSAEGAAGIFGIPIPAYPTFGVPRPPYGALCLSFPPGSMLRVPEQGRAASSRVCFGAGSRGWSITPAGIREPWAARRTWHFLLFVCSAGGVCTRFVSVVTQGRARGWEFPFFQAPFPGHPTARGREIPGCQHHGKAQLLPDRMPGTGKAGPLRARAEERELPLAILRSCPSCPSLPPGSAPDHPMDAAIGIP